MQGVGRVVGKSAGDRRPGHPLAGSTSAQAAMAAGARRSSKLTGYTWSGRQLDAAAKSADGCSMAEQRRQRGDRTRRSRG